MNIEWTALGPWIAVMWGALWGSFANVVIHRLPRGESLVYPPSRCPACETPIRPWHNVPVVGWLWLRGRCAACRAPISPRYPLVELSAALLAWATWEHTFDAATPWPSAAAAGLVFFFVLALVIIAFIDLDYRIIPHELTVPFIALGPAVAWLFGDQTGVTWVESALGVVLGGGVVWLVIQIYFWIRKAEGMGGGDFMLMAALGAWLGYPSVIFLFFASSLQGTAVAVALFATGKAFPKALPWPSDAGSDPEPPTQPAVDAEHAFGRMELPFGPFLVLAGLEWLFFETWIMDITRILYGWGE